MYASLGGALFASGILSTVVFALIFRHPKAPGWTQGELVAELVAVLLTAIVGLGLGYLAVAVMGFASDGVRWPDLAGLGAAAALLIVAWWALDPRRRFKAYEDAAAGGPIAADVIDLAPTPAPHPGPASRRAA